MRSTSKWSKILAVVLALLIIGALRGLKPEYLPNEAPRHPDSDGVVRIDGVDVQLRDVAYTSTIIPAGSEVRLETGHVFVVARYTMTALENRISPRVRIDSEDGYEYWPTTEAIGSDYSTTSVMGGTSRTMTIAVEIPQEKIDGAKIVVSTAIPGQLEPMKPVAEFELEPPDHVEEYYEVLPDEVTLTDD